MRSHKMFLSALALALTVGCNGTDATDSGSRFLNGTAADPEIGLVINSTGKALTMFQLGNPSKQRQIPFGASTAVTPTGLARRGTQALVPLGDAASTALIDLEGARITRFFTFPSGNATGSAWVDDTTFVVANLVQNYLGKATLGQEANEITTTVNVPTAPSAVAISAGRAFVVSANYTVVGMSVVYNGNGIVTAIDLATMTVIDEVESGGTNSSAAAIGPDGKLYVLNTGDYVADASVTVIDPSTLTVETTVTGFPAGSGSIRIENDGTTYVSSASAGTVVWNTNTREFVQDESHDTRVVCAGDPCRGGFDADRAMDGSIYQVFFGTPWETTPLPPYIFVFAPTTYELVDSIPAGVGPTNIEIARFRN